ncbi:C1 family peptidase [Baia soyae]|uniref:Papain like protease n=1 Tax=Baia soyae TaxID=1544746 RepID=A0A4V2SYA1_9BACL|nr:C1 family peptidase [Baia soyae]TCP69211.1 papain like protease [Baia soyae]
MKRALLWMLALVVTLTSTLFGSSAEAKLEHKPFNPNDFSTYGTGLKDGPRPEGLEEYTPAKRFVTKDELKKQGKNKQQINPDQILPQKVDLRPYFAPIRSQSKFGTCVVFATTGLREYYIGRHTEAKGKDVTHLSPSYIYYPSGPDEGLSFYTAFEILRREGVPPETERPYDPDRSNTDQFKAPKTVLQRENAAPYKIDSFRFIRDNSSMVDNVKRAVANGDPVMFGIPVYPNFDATPSTGIIPAVEEKKSRGGHALVVVGYDDENEWFIIRNSWGEKFGDKGYAYMGYDIFKEMNDDFGYVANIRNNDYPPQGVKLSVSASTSTTMMLDVSAINATSFDLYRDGKFVKSFTGATVKDEGLKADATYKYHVVAKNGRGGTRSVTVEKVAVGVELEKAS